jgi:hypothetical protein
LSWWPATASGSTASARPASGLASHDYFLAEGSLTWWAIGASLIASNISAEQFIGMSGSGYRIGMAIAVYELMAAATLVIVAVFFMPVYLKHHIYTMPQFLEQRYGKAVATTMALFWLGLYVVVNLTSILYLGALAISSLSGIALLPCMLFLAVFAAIITLGGMKVIGYTDVVQVACLVIGGLVTTWLALDLVASLANGHGALAGLSELYKSTRDHFDMVLTRDNANYMDLPGLSILLGGMWIVNLNYWGCNQYITQRAGRRPADRTQRPTVCRLPETADAGDRGTARHRRVRAGPFRHAGRRHAPGRRTESRPRLPDPAGSAAIGPERRGVCRPHRRRGGIAGRQGQLHRHHLHAGHLQAALPQGRQRAKPGVDRPPDRGGRHAAGGADRAALGIDKQGGFSTSRNTPALCRRASWPCS